MSDNKYMDYMEKQLEDSRLFGVTTFDTITLVALVKELQTLNNTLKGLKDIVSDIAESVYKS